MRRFAPITAAFLLLLLGSELGAQVRPPTVIDQVIEERRTREATGEEEEGASDEATGAEQGSDAVQEQDEESFDDPPPVIIFNVPEEVAYSDRVVSVEVLCNIPYCDDIDGMQALEDVTGIWAGQVFSEARLQIAVQRLKKTGFFSQVQAIAEHAADGYRVRFETQGHLFIRKVSFGETGTLFESDIAKRLFLRAGRPLEPRAAALRKLPERNELTQAQRLAIALEDQRESIRRMYEAEGYYDAKVDVRCRGGDAIEELAQGGACPELEPFRVELEIDVEQGQPYLLGRLFVRGNQRISQDTIDDVFRSEFGFFSHCTVEQIEKGARAVLFYYRHAGYLNARLDWDYRRVDPGDGVKQGYFEVYLDIVEGRHWSIVVNGNAFLSREELIEDLDFYDIGYIDEAELRAGAAQIKALYATVGHYWASVDASARLLGENEAEIRIDVEEGQRTEIGAIVFEGVSVFSQETLLETIRSQPYQAFGSGAYPQLSLIADDASLIVDLYHAQGYLQADVPAWTLQADEQGGLTLRFEVFEGPQTLTGRVELESAGEPPPDGVIESLQSRPGQPFVLTSLAADQARLLRPYRKLGYALAAVSVRCLADGGELDQNTACETPDLPPECFPVDPAELCTNSDGQQSCRRYYSFAENDPLLEACKPGRVAERMSVVFDIEAGRKHYVGDFFVHGNFVTADWVVTQDIPFEKGDPFDYNGLLETRSRLRSRAIYQSVTVEPIGLEEEIQQRLGDTKELDLALEYVPLVISIEEGERRWLDFAMGTSFVSAEWLATTEIEFVEANLFGSGWEFRLLFLPEFRFINANGEFVLSKNFNQNWFFLGTFQIPLSSLYGIDLLLQGFYELRYIPSTWREEQGGVAELQWDMTRRWFASLALEGKLSATSGLVEDADDFDPCLPVTYFQDCPFGQRFQTYSIIPRVLYEGRNSVISPTKGFYFEAKTKIAYSEEVGIFVKPDLRFSTYWHFLRNFTVALNTRLGFALLESDKTLPLFERFFLGGISVRGFENDAVGPRRVDLSSPGVATHEAGGGELLLNTSLELRFPILKDLGIHGVLFWDSGSILAKQMLSYSSAQSFFEDVFVDELRHTAGLGLRWLIADNLPPIVLDYGLVLDRRLGEPLGGLHLNVGYAF
ncbi:MAG: BamA/TamA family outer membrane protein [Myxococcota bacterium]|jgi:outer membrane protein assembly factor BamA|nr:BamA/TamA family outer membrane protein [Myxococcota bacterium]